MLSPECSPLQPLDWPAPAHVRAGWTTRQGGVSAAPYHSLNLGLHVGDDPRAVQENRARLRRLLPAEPVWLNQVHGVELHHAQGPTAAPVTADGSWTDQPSVVCAVMTADCLPVLLCDRAGTRVAAVHAGWRGLAAGVLEAALRAMQRPASELLVYLGPAIGPSAFEVGEDVRAVFVAAQPAARACFVPSPRPGHWWADLPGLARLRLQQQGVQAVWGGQACTYSQPELYFSHRRDQVSGRMVSLIWLEPSSGERLFAPAQPNMAAAPQILSR